MQLVEHFCIYLAKTLFAKSIKGDGDYATNNVFFLVFLVDLA